MLFSGFTLLPMHLTCIVAGIAFEPQGMEWLELGAGSCKNSLLAYISHLQGYTSKIPTMFIMAYSLPQQNFLVCARSSKKLRGPLWTAVLRSNSANVYFHAITEYMYKPLLSITLNNCEKKKKKRAKWQFLILVDHAQL